MLGERKLHAALVAALAAFACALASGVAMAAPPLVDDAVADFPSNASTWSVEPGVVQRRPATLSLNFDGPHGLEVTPEGAATMDSGALAVNNGRVNTFGFSSLPQTLEFRATFAAGDDQQHVGFGNTLNQSLWAIISTGGPGLTTGLWARTQANVATGTHTAITGVDLLVPHTYRIVWEETSVTYFVDGVLKATHNVAVTDMMRPIVSDSSDAGVIAVDWLAQGTVSAPADFVSRVHDTSDDRVIWDAVTTTPGDAAIETRTGDVPAPDGTWSAWEATGAAGTIVSPRGRYIQYSATLTDSDPVLDSVEITYHHEPTAAIDGVQVWDGDATVSFSSPDPGIDDFECSIDGTLFAWCSSPFVFNNLATGSHTVRVRALDEAVPPHKGPIVEVTFDVDATPPSVVIGASQVTGSQATTSFSSPDADAQLFECSVDGGAFAACTSPATFSGLAVGPHTVRVRARDVAGNTGASDAWGFSVKPPGSGTQAAEDDTAPVIKLLSRRGRVSGRGSVTVQVGCPAGEIRCRLTLRAGSGPKKTATIRGGKSAKVPLKLTAATRRKLATRGRLSVKIQIVARDDAGNRRTKEYRFTLLAPR